MYTPFFCLRSQQNNFEREFKEQQLTYEEKENNQKKIFEEMKLQFGKFFSFI